MREWGCFCTHERNGRAVLKTYFTKMLLKALCEALCSVLCAEAS